MRAVTLFIMSSCPYCQQALRWMEALCNEHPDYAQVKVRIIDEIEQPDIASQYDYYYVPTYYVGDKKQHEGAATKAKIEAVYRAALEETQA